MPAPSENQIPKHEYWGFVQKDIHPLTELPEFCKNIVIADGKTLTDKVKEELLSFLPSSDKVKAWSDYWVTIMNTLGIGYVSAHNNILHKTRMADYMANGGVAEYFYLTWGLNFQIPFAQTKQKEFKEKGIALNPVVIIIEAIALIFLKTRNKNLANPFESSYLSIEEIVLKLMKLRSNSSIEVTKSVNEILQNRLNNYYYTAEKVTGYESNASNFSSRARLYLEKSGIIKFNASKTQVLISDWQHLAQCLNFLSYKKAPVKIELGALEEEQRISLFENRFNSIDIEPDRLYMSVHRSDNLVKNGFSMDITSTLTGLMKNEGVFFEESFIESFLLSLKTKPFVILSGISGVGKSILPKTIMQILGNQECRAIAVAPDWTDNMDMLGYFNVDGDFVQGEFTGLVLSASKTPEIPYFIILDEMNLARVEYYFAQVLSVMESRFYNEGKGHVSYRDFLFNSAMRKRLSSSKNEQDRLIGDLAIGHNVFIVGTVNVDESTHPFSKKVLDRANVLQISSIDLFSGLESGVRVESKTILGATTEFAGTITNIKELLSQWELNTELSSKIKVIDTLKVWVEELDKFNKILSSLKFNFGLRVRDEVCIYLYYAAVNNIDKISEGWWYKYFDQQLTQKILTKVFGEEDEIETTLIQLFEACLTSDSSNVITQDEVLKYDLSNGDKVKYLGAARKLQNMLLDLLVNRKHSVSFWTS